jgi:hypothetical protein
MNISSWQRVALLSLALGTAGVTATFAQTTPTPTPAPTTPPAGDHPSILTDDEKAELKKDHDAVFAANPDFQTQMDALKAKHEALKAQGDSASADDRKALHEQGKALRDQINAAIVKLDPAAAAIIAKLEAAHKDWHHQN